MSNPKQKDRRMWALKQRAEDAKTLELYIYGDVDGDSYDWWTDETIQSETSAIAFRDALAVHPEATEIAVYINSYGGSARPSTTSSSGTAPTRRCMWTALLVPSPRSSQWPATRW